MTTIKTFDDIFFQTPPELRLLVVELGQIGQHPAHHPEGDVLTHTRIVTERAIKAGFDINVIVAAFFHDIGKGATQGVNEKTGYPTAYGHERVSAKIVNMYSEFVESLGADPEIVEWLCSQHMRFKRLDEMRPAKVQRLKAHDWFELLEQLGSVDKGGTDV